MRSRSRGGFTLIEILLAAVAASLVLGAVYGIFHQAIRVRDAATLRVRDSRVRLRAEKIIRGDLGNALVSGGLLANVCAGDSASPDRTSTTTTNASNIPGYLKFTTTSGRNDAATGLYGDVEQVEYYIASDPTAADQSTSGILMRSVTRDLLDTTGLSSSATTTSTATAGSTAGSTGTGAATAGGAAPVVQTPVLTGVQSFQVAFYDGSNWQTSWQFSDLSDRISPAAAAATTTTSTGTSSQVTTGQTSLPDALRIAIQQGPDSPGGPLPAPLEILVPWNTQPFVAATPATAGSATSP